MPKVIFVIFLSCTLLYRGSLGLAETDSIGLFLDKLEDSDSFSVLYGRIVNLSNESVTNVSIQLVCGRGKDSFSKTFNFLCDKTVTKRIRNRTTGETEERSWKVCEKLLPRKSYTFSVTIPTGFSLSNCNGMVTGYSLYERIRENFDAPAK